VKRKRSRSASVAPVVPESNPFASLPAPPSPAPVAQPGRALVVMEDTPEPSGNGHGQSTSTAQRGKLRPSSRHPLIPPEQVVEIRSLFFDHNLSAIELAAHTGLSRMQINHWLARIGWPKERRANIERRKAEVAKAAAQVVEPLAPAHAEALKRIHEGAIREGEKEVESLRRTASPTKRLVHARTLSTLLGSMRTASSEEKVRGTGFAFDFRNRFAAMKRVREAVRPTLPRG